MGGPLIGAIEALGRGDWLGVLAEVVVLALLLLVCFPVHEMAHALVAKWLGDDTGEQLGRITLNPLAHLDPLGAILFALAGFGWAKPVPVNVNRLNGNPSTSFALVALAGPASNILMAAIFGVLFRIVEPLGASDAVLNSLGIAVNLNVILALFNMIPVPPLDGSRILAMLLPPAAQEVMNLIGRYGFIVVFMLSRIGVFSLLINQPANALTRLILGF